MDDIPFLTVWVPATEAARRIGISRQRINRLIQLGEFDTVHRLEGSRQYVIRKDEIERYALQRVNRTQLNTQEEIQDVTL